MNINDEFQTLQKQTKQIRKKRYVVSRLDFYKGELIELHGKGATAAELKRWLRKKRIKVVYSTVYRWVQKHG